MASPSNKQTQSEREFIEICDWESFQYSGSHRKPNPPWPWFRLHNTFIASSIWFAMTKPQRSDFITLLSLVSRYGNMIPKDVKWLRSQSISSKTLPSLVKLSLIRCFSVSADDKRIRELRSVLSGGTPRREEEKRKEEIRGGESKEDSQERTPAPGVKDSSSPIPDVPIGHPLSSFGLGQLSDQAKRKDPRPFDELKLKVKPHIQKFGADPDLIYRFAGPSLEMSKKQIAECVRQLVSDCEVTLPVEPLVM